MIRLDVYIMSNFKLNLPTDIPWKRICVTEDMVDKKVCDDRLPSKWQSSLAVFKYKPDDEYQLYPDYDITYLKVTATITGYQPLDDEIQGNIDWDGVDVSTIPGLKDLLNSYNPCHGAILQVSVGPNSDRGIKLDNYPFFMDFEPKKRELYEMATDTMEKSSRSIESLNITNSAGTTQSMEVLDVDMGGGGFGANASYAGTGGGFNYSAPNGQWGTRRMNSDESLASRSSDIGQEKRETFSHTTQLSQMYHLLDSYHLGTNRAVFFVQPRPHTLEEPSGFVKGPRPVEGIQEFFLIVAQPKDQKDFCVSLRLDTSHITTTPVLDYERKTDLSQMASAYAPIPNENDTLGLREKWGEACLVTCWDMYYQCYLTSDTDEVVYQAPAGYKIESYNNVINTTSSGSTSVSITPDRKSLSIHAQASGKNCYEDTFGCVDCPDTWQKRSGEAKRQVQVNLISTEPTQQIGEKEVLMITTRGLCCCTSDNGRLPLDEYVVGIKPVPGKYTITDFDTDQLMMTRSEIDKGEYKAFKDDGSKISTKKSGCGCNDISTAPNQSDAKTKIRKANELGKWIKVEAIKNLNDPTSKPQKYVDTEFFTKQLERKLLQFRKGREILNMPASKTLPKAALSKVAKHLRKSEKELTRKDLLSLRSNDLAKLTGVKESEISKAKMSSMGIDFKGKVKLASEKIEQATKYTKKKKK